MIFKYKYHILFFIIHIHSTRLGYSNKSYVTNIVKLDSGADIYDYLTNIYLEYKKSGNYKGFSELLTGLIYD